MSDEDSDFTDRAILGASDFGHDIVTFCLFAPGKRSVHLQGTFNAWDWKQDSMRDRGGGYFVIQKKLPPGCHEYQFVIDGSLAICDPCAHEIKIIPGYETPNAIVRSGQPIYHWRHSSWQRPRLDDLIIYELHVGDFSPEGTFQGVIERLDYLRDLGINAIEFLPLCESSSYWGYEPLYPFAVRSSYGSPEDLYRLVDEAHARGIGVIQDLVLSHTSKQHPFMALYPYDQSPWYGKNLGEANQFGLPMLDFTKDATNNLTRQVQNYWMRNFHFDGFRYDYLAGIGGDMEGRGLPALIKDARCIHPEAYLIGECIPENPALVNGSGLSGVWHTRSSLLLSTLLVEKDRQPYAWQDFAGGMQALNPNGQDYGEAAFMVNYGECHDDERLVGEMMKAGFDNDTAMRKAMLGMALLLTMPGEAMLYQGQEWGEDTRKSLGPNKLHWEKRETPWGHALLEHSRQMCLLRRSRPSVRRNEFQIIALCPDKKCVVYKRQYGEMDQVMVALNFSGQRQTLDVSVPVPGPWREIDTEIIRDMPANLSLELDAFASKIFCIGVS